MDLSRFWWLPLGAVPQITPAELKRWLDEGRPLQLADARTAAEYQQGTLRGARHAPVTEMPGSIARLNLEPAVPVVVLCLSGHRSQPATRWLKARGYQAYSLKGGLQAWKKAGFTLNPAKGKPR